jgi:ribonuclease HI
MYLGALMVIPYNYVQEYTSLVSKVTIPYGGTGFRYHHLLPAFPPLHFKPHLRDLWTSNLAALASRFDFSPHLSPTSEPPVPSIEETSCRISEHVKFASEEYILWRNKAVPAIRHDDLSKETSSRHSLYNHLIKYAYQATAKKDWARKLEKLGITHSTSLGSLSSNFKSVSSSTPDFARTFFLSFLLKTLPTSKRLRHFPGASPTLPCPFCLSEEADDFRHFVSNCPPLWDSLAGSPMGSVCGFKEVSPDPLHRLQVISLTTDHPDSTEKKNVINCIIAFVSGALFARRRVLAQTNPSGLQDFMSAHITAYFDALTKKQRSRVLATKKAISSILAIPPSSTIVYTDGSASPNPGPSGAGAWICPPSNNNFCLYRALGLGSNNIGELWAIGMAIAFISDQGWSNDVVICTDSEYSIGVLSLGHQPKTLIPLITKIQSIMAKANYKCSFIWVPGHSDIEGNEIADRLAGKGTTISTSRALPALFPLNTDLSWRICPQTPQI